MFVLRVVFGAQTLPELVQDQLIALVPGSVFGFVIDRLQFVAKPMLLVGLALLGVPFGALVGWLYGRLHRRRGRWELLGGAACGIVVWLAFELAVVALGDGVSAAVATGGWLLLSAEVYGIALVLLVRLIEVPMEQAAPVDRQRRLIVFSGLGGSALLVAGGALARMLATNVEQQAAPEPTEAQAATAPTTQPPSAAPPEPAIIPKGVADEVTPNERFYIVSKNFNDPRVSADKWSLEVLGLVAQPRRFSYEEILAMPTVSQYTTLECISNTLGGNLMSNAHWTGVPLSELVSGLGAQPEAQAIIFRSADNYYESFPLDVALAPGVLLAHTMNGVPLPDKHGFPLRLILPGRYGVKSPKWITRIEFYQASEPIAGYWVRRGWDAEALAQTVARIDTPQNNANLTGSHLQVGGVAFAGSRGIARVEASADGGRTWREADTRPPLGSSTWGQWGLTWHDLSPGTHEVLARATDGTGALQTSEENGSFPAGATGYHRARVNIVG